MDLYDLLFLLKQEYLKLRRISKNFNRVIKDNIENQRECKYNAYTNRIKLII